MFRVVKLASHAVLALGLTMGVPAFFPANSPAAAQSIKYDGARQVVNRTQSDLTRSTGLLHDKKEQERFRNAQRTLSKFDRHLAKGKFDKDTLDSAIEDIQHVLDHNTLQGQDRDTLLEDIRQLRDIRAER